ncbi:MAG TPA: ABC transporter ATP-binding protein [Anaerolineales bacterium]|jgi:ABC-2 type transport system ATP-binding protein
MNFNPEQNGSSSPPDVLVAENLRKSYGPRQALQGLTFTLKAGRVMGFLGPNGAGKTTSIRILTTMLEPEAGHFIVDGTGSEFPEKIRRKIGVLPENLGFPRQMTGIEYLTYFGQLYGRTARNARAHGLSLLEEVGMQQRAKSLIGTYSHGMKQRIGIARALVNDPIVAFFDEPTLGLDPRGQQELLTLIQRIARERGTGVVLCSHLLSEIEGICDDVIILSAGQIVAQGPVKDVVGQGQQNVMRVRVPPELVEKTRDILSTVPDVISVLPTGQMGGWLGVNLANPDGASPDHYRMRNKILDHLIRFEIPILSFEADGGRLQDVFLQLTEEAIK